MFEGSENVEPDAHGSTISSVGGIKIRVDRGWTSVEARIGKRAFRLVNTHLEAFGDPKIREAQAKELTKGPLKTKTQVVLVGDLNPAANGSVELLDGTDGMLIHRFEGAALGDRMGAAVSTAGDVDGDDG